MSGMARVGSDRGLGHDFAPPVFALELIFDFSEALVDTVTIRIISREATGSDVTTNIPMVLTDLLVPLHKRLH